MSDILEFRELITKALVTTLELTVLGILLTMVFAFTFGLMRLSRHTILRGISYAVVEVLRGTSLVVQLFWVFYALPFMGYQLDPIFAGVLVLGLNEGAYAAEIVRSTINSRPRGQTEACIALGLSPTQRMVRILIPQSVPGMLPGFGNVCVDLMKATALVSLVTIQDLTYVANSIRQQTGETLLLYALLLVLYFAIAMALTAVVRMLEKRFAVSRPVPRRRMVEPGAEVA